VGGQNLSSEELAALIAKKASDGQSALTVLIGGAYGLSAEARTAADLALSFSSFTFTHQLIRLLLAEQLYRACKIINKEPYHNG
jgi:23S rRNA (pseudouridine1915-N3)-methyltransferase